MIILSMNLVVRALGIPTIFLKEVDTMKNAKAKTPASEPGTALLAALRRGKGRVIHVVCTTSADQVKRLLTAKGGKHARTLSVQDGIVDDQFTTPDGLVVNFLSENEPQ